MSTKLNVPDQHDTVCRCARPNSIRSRRSGSSSERTGYPNAVDSVQVDYIGAAARRFLTVAKITRQAYSFDRHDPAVILADVLADLGNPEQESLDGRFAARTLAGVRVMFRDERDAFGCLLAHCEAVDMAVEDYAQTWIGPAVSRR